MYVYLSRMGPLYLLISVIVENLKKIRYNDGIRVLPTVNVNRNISSLWSPVFFLLAENLNSV